MPARLPPSLETPSKSPRPRPSITYPCKVTWEIGTSVFVFASAVTDSMISSAVLSDGHALLVDPGVLESEVEHIAAFVEARGATVETILLTHHHWDHVLATRRWPSARRIAHPKLESLVLEQQADPQYDAMLRSSLPQVPEQWRLLPIEPLASRSIRIGVLDGTLLELPGHAPDALGLLLPSERVLFSTDMLDPNEWPLPDHDRELYLLSLARIEALVQSGQVEHVVPGHGWPLLGSQAVLTQIARDRSYLGKQSLTG